MFGDNDYTWFIDPVGDERTNNIIASVLAERAEECACVSRRCGDDQERSLWECPNHEFLRNFEETAKRCRFHYAIYVRQGRHGAIRLWRFRRQAPRIHRVKGKLTLTCH
jgi:hypothetical protein